MSWSFTNQYTSNLSAIQVSKTLLQVHPLHSLPHTPSCFGRQDWHTHQSCSPRPPSLHHTGWNEGLSQWEFGREGGSGPSMSPIHNLELSPHSYSTVDSPHHFTPSTSSVPDAPSQSALDALATIASTLYAMDNGSASLMLTLTPSCC